MSQKVSFWSMVAIIAGTMIVFLRYEIKLDSIGEKIALGSVICILVWILWYGFIRKPKKK